MTVSAPGCCRSVLIRNDDTTYRRGLEHYQRTRRRIAAALAPEDDEAMFLQAESLFRYRFSPPPRSFGSYVAEAGAAVADLPVLEALAGSLDLYGVRLRSYDGAIQLWETLLDRDPGTPLRPLTLYRLGWAYRNSIVSGLPRTSDAAFDELVKQHAGTPEASLATEAKKVKWKSQSSATAWSLVPGLGQIYVGEYANGAVRLAIALAATSMVVVPAVMAYEQNSDLSWSKDWPLIVIAAAGATILTLDYSSSYQDAMRATLEYNERGEADFEAAHPEAP
jgi:hypothetical protein